MNPRGEERDVYIKITCDSFALKFATLKNIMLVAYYIFFLFRFAHLFVSIRETEDGSRIKFAVYIFQFVDFPTRTYRETNKDDAKCGTRTEGF